ncbi:MAG: tetratricopeptide repeat protein, partial [Maribacter sp.]|nr:tetratricopeptide repeat protein [Maribacter sp.]
SKPYMDSLLREAMDGRFPKYLALAYKAEGLYHYYASDFHQAEKSYEKSISIYNELDLNIPLSRMYNNQGIVLKYLGKLQKSKEHHLNSLKLKEELQLPPSDIAASLVNLGVLENELGNGELSTDYYLRAEEICIDNNLIRGLNLVRGNLAGNFKDAKKYDLALKYYKLVYDYHEENNDYRNIARITNSMGSLYFSLDSLQKAKSYYLEANELNKKHAIEQMRGLTTRNLGKIAMKEKSYNEALSYFLEANKISQTTGTNTRNVGDYLNISEAYAALGDYKNAYANRKIHFTKYDSVFQKEKIEQINELEIKYQTEKKEAEIALQEEEINTLNEKAKVDKLTKGLYAGGMASALALCGLSVFGYRQRIKKNRIAREKQEEIYKQEIAYKKKELTSQTLHLVQKNTFIQELMENLQRIKSSPEKFKMEFRRIVMLLKKENASDKDWEVFKAYFSEVHNDFDQKLKTISPDVSEKEIRLAAFLRMNLTTKEIAATLNVLPDSILKSKYRLKKKLGLDKENDLNSFLNAL